MSGKSSFLSSQSPHCLTGLPSRLINRYRVDQRAVQQLATHLHLSAEVKNKWSYTSMLPTRLNGLNRYNLTYTFTSY